MKQLTVEAAVENIETVTAFVAEELEKLNCPMKAETQITIAIDELFGNIARYAYFPEIGQATVRFDVENNPLAVIITFIDNGVPFNPLNAPAPNLDNPEERREGGLGIFLVRRYSDRLQYEYTQKQNMLKIIKNRK